MGKKRIKKLFNLLKSGWEGLNDIFFPPLCIGCDCTLEHRSDILCDYCLARLPRTEHARFRGNMVEQMFADLPPKHALVRGGAFCYYEYGSVFRHMIHTFKYSAYPQIGVYFGQLAATDFQQHGFFDDIDLLVPVPLHVKRLRNRTYNQSELICQGIAQITNLPVDTTHLVRIVNNETQTKKTFEERKQNAADIFKVNQPQEWKNKHILLVDDIITTGSTLKACIQATNQIKGLRVSIFTLGMAHIPILIEEEE